MTTENEALKLTDDELRHAEVYGSYWDKQHAKDELNRRHIESVRRGRIVGDVIEFVRHGDPVEFSTNHCDGTKEAGMSVYLLDCKEVIYVGFWFNIAAKPAFRGQGEIVAFGSDGEPVVKVIGSCVRSPEFDRK